MKTILSLLIILTAFNGISQCASDMNIYSFTANGISYELVKENKSWVDAATCAVERGGFLARIDSLEEQNAVYSELSTSAGIITANTVAPDGGGAAYVWLGGTDKFVEGRWIWDGNNDGTGDQFWEGTSTGLPIGGLYNNWGTEPDDFSGQDGLGLALTSWPFGIAGEWNDVDTTNTLYYLIEYPSSANIDELNDKVEFRYDASQQQIILKNWNNLVGIKIFDTSGKLVLESTEKSEIIEVGNLNSGTYIIQLTQENGFVNSQKFVR